MNPATTSATAWAASTGQAASARFRDPAQRLTGTCVMQVHPARNLATETGHYRPGQQPPARQPAEADALILSLWRRVRGLQSTDGINGADLITAIEEFLAEHGKPLPEPGTPAAAPSTAPTLGKDTQVQTYRRAECRRTGCGWHGPLRPNFPAASTDRQDHLDHHRRRLA